MRTREALAALIEGRLASPAGRSELVELATRLIVEEALEGEVRDTLDRGYYEHGDVPSQGHRNGHRTQRLKSAEGSIEYSAPQVAGLKQPFRSALRDHLKGHTEALEGLAVEMLARGLSVRDIEDAFKDETGRLLLSKTAVAEIGNQLWEDYQAFKSRDLAEYDVAYLFIDGIAERIRPGQKREPVLAAWGFTFDGRKVLLHLPPGPAGPVSSGDRMKGLLAFHGGLEGGRRDGFRLLPRHAGTRPRRPLAGRQRWRTGRDQGALWGRGVPTAPLGEVCFPRSARQRCLAHRMRNLAAKVPDDLWPEFKARATAAYQAPSRKIARELADGLEADYGTVFANATACLRDDFEACIAHLRLPIAHRRATRTTNLRERLFVEERRRLKIIPNAFGEKAVLKLMFGAMTRAAERWRSIKITDFERRQMTALRQEFDHDYEASVGLDPSHSRRAAAA
jgi:transposase-like protein